MFIYGSSSPGAVTGGIIGGFIGLAIFFAIVAVCVKICKKQNDDQDFVHNQRSIPLQVRKYVFQIQSTLKISAFLTRLSSKLIQIFTLDLNYLHESLLSTFRYTTRIIPVISSGLFLSTTNLSERTEGYLS